MFILLGNACNDYALASILSIIRRGFNIIQIVVPILLIISSTIQFVKLTINPDDDKKGMKKIYNSFFSAIIIFFIPMVINLSMNIIHEYGDVGIEEGETTQALNISSCWTEAKQTQNIMDSVRENGGSKSSTIKSEKKEQRALLGSSPYKESSEGSNNNSYSSSSNKNSKGDSVITYAKQFLGNKYVYGGTSLTDGTDCSGFVMSIYKNFGIDLPHSSDAQATMGTAVDGLENAKAGDIICYNGHVALFMGDGMKIIHASNSRDGIKISDRADYRTIVAIRRVLND